MHSFYAHIIPLWFIDVIFLSFISILISKITDEWIKQITRSKCMFACLTGSCCFMTCEIAVCFAVLSYSCYYFLFGVESGMLAVPRRLFCFGSLVILDVARCYLWLFTLYINIKISKNSC